MRILALLVSEILFCIHLNLLVIGMISTLGEMDVFYVSPSVYFFLKFILAKFLNHKVTIDLVHNGAEWKSRA